MNNHSVAKTRTWYPPMVKGLATSACALVMLAACDSSAAVPPASETPSISSADTPAASLRVHADLLLAEHVFVIAKLAAAAGAGRQDEFHSYAGLLAANGGDIEALLRTAIGETAGARFGAAWAEQNNSLVDYVVAAVTQDESAGGSALSSLTGTAVPDIAAALESGFTISSAEATKLAGDHVTLLKTVVDDVASANYAGLYADIVSARTQAVTFGDTVALQVARQFSDRFPGDATTKAAVFRTNLNALLQQQGYLLTMATDGTDANASAAETTLDSSATQLAALYGGDDWLSKTALVTSYAKSGDASTRASVIAASPAGLTAAWTALLQVVDDQRSKEFTAVAADDRAMAAAFATAADQVSLSSPS